MNSRRDRDVQLNLSRDPVPSTSELDQGQVSDPEQATLEKRIVELANQPLREVSNPRAGNGKSARKLQSRQKELHDEAQEHDTASRRPSRFRELEQAPSVHLRPEEIALLADVGRFRVVGVSDLQEHLYPLKPASSLNTPPDLLTD